MQFLRAFFNPNPVQCFKDPRTFSTWTSKLQPRKKLLYHNSTTATTPAKKNQSIKSNCSIHSCCFRSCTVATFELLVPHQSRYTLTEKKNRFEIIMVMFTSGALSALLLVAVSEPQGVSGLRPSNFYSRQHAASLSMVRMFLWFRFSIIYISICIIVF